jgi:hypothetical protein
MKRSIKHIILFAIILGGTITAKAQTISSETNSSSKPNSIIFSAGAETGITTGSLRGSHNWTLGGSIQADIPVAEQLYVTVNTGYQNYFGNDHNYSRSLTNTDIHAIPAKAGLKYFPINRFYIQGEAGADFILNKSSVGFDKSAAFIYAPQIGVQFPIGGKSFIDAGVRYEGSTKFSDNDQGSKVNLLGLRVAYAFAVK